MQTLSTGYQLPKDKEILNCWIWRFDECIIIFFLTHVKSKIYLCGRGYSQVPAVPNSLKMHPKNTQIWGKKAIKIFNLTPKKLLRTAGDQGCSAKWQCLGVKKTTTACTQLYLIYVGIAGCLGRWFKRARNNLLFGSWSVHKTLYRFTETDERFL